MSEFDVDRMLLEDYAINALPRSLENVLNSCRRTSLSDLSLHDYTTILIYVSMLELGFVSLDYDVALDQYCDEYFSYRRLLQNTEAPCLPTTSLLGSCDGCSTFMRKLSFCFPKYPHHICKIVSVQADSDVIVNGWLDSKWSVGKSLLIDPLLYVILPRKDTSAAADATENSKHPIFQDLKKLAWQFKENVGYPLKRKLLKKNDDHYGMIEKLPPELVHTICKCCDKKSSSTLKKALRWS